MLNRARCSRGSQDKAFKYIRSVFDIFDSSDIDLQIFSDVIFDDLVNVKERHPTFPEAKMNRQ